MSKEISSRTCLSVDDSPPGLSIIDARLAIWNFLWANKTGGEFILFVKSWSLEKIDAVLTDLEWLGISPSRVIRRAERIEIYKDHLVKLVDSGCAYPCTQSSLQIATEEAEIIRSGGVPVYRGPLRNQRREDNINLFESEWLPVRFRIPDDEYVIGMDLVQGQQRWDTSQLSDPLIADETGSCSELMMDAIDVHELGITHAIRPISTICVGTEILLGRAMGYKPIIYAHPGNILNELGHRLSKHNGESLCTSNQKSKLLPLDLKNESRSPTYISFYRKLGYSPEALFHYLGRLGCGPTCLNAVHPSYDFNLIDVKKDGQRINFNIIEDLSELFLQRQSVEERALHCLPFLQKTKWISSEPTFEEFFRVMSTVDLCGSMIKSYSDIVTIGKWAFTRPSWDMHHVKANIIEKALQVRLRSLLESFRSTCQWNKKSIEDRLFTLAPHMTQRILLLNALQICLTGKLEVSSPNVYGMAEVLGNEETCWRLNYILGLIPR